MGGALGAQAGLAPSSPSWNGVYTDAQAQRGEPLYGRFCANCHTRDLIGGERAPALTGPGFVAKWSARPLADLLGYIQGAMPLNSPGAVGRQQNADILAFVLKTSGAGAGTKDIAPFPGTEPLEADVPPPPGPPAAPLTKRVDAYYTEAQAARGKAAFNRNCAYCHTVDPKRSTPEDLLQALPSTFGGHFLERIVNGKRVYPNVYVLYSKLQSMPATDTHSITEENRVDIASYIMQANGYPAGTTEIPVNPGAMQLMNLNEEGFEPIFNGKDLRGLRFRLGLHNNPGDQLSIENGTLVCSCNVHGVWSSEKRYHDFTLRFDTRFERPADWFGDDELFSGGSGVLILGRPTGNGSIEIEGRHRDFLQAFAIGGKATWAIDLEAKRRAIRPLGEWNSVEIVSKGKTIKVWLNGTLVTTVSDHDYAEPGPISFQLQGAKMYWRNVRVRPE
jgi:mono/diheme cytochrome c family protein